VTSTDLRWKKVTGAVGGNRAKKKLGRLRNESRKKKIKWVGCDGHWAERNWAAQRLNRKRL
jgi:hypothetical protein